MFFHGTCLSISLNHGLPMARVYFIPTICTQPDPEIYTYSNISTISSTVKRCSGKSLISIPHNTSTYFILCTGYQHGSDRSRMRGKDTYVYVRLWNYAPHTSSILYDLC